MTEAGERSSDALADALLAARLCAIDPGLGGMILRGGGVARDAVMAALIAALPQGTPVKRVPVNVDDERLLGGIDLTSTLATGTTVTRAGLLAEADGGVVVLTMAERMNDARAGRIAAAVDAGARFLLIALDDGAEDEERVPGAVAERVAFHFDLSEDVAPPLQGSGWDGDGPDRIRASEHRDLRHPNPAPEGERLEKARLFAALAATALALGIDSARASRFALRAARASARLAGRDEVIADDVALAARLVLAPRATRVPVEAAGEAAEPPPPPRESNDGGDDDRKNPGILEDIVLAAALASLPKDVLARIAAGRGRQRGAARTSGAGERRKSAARGRPMGTRAGVPGGGLRLSLIDTLRAAAPWQKLRGGGGGRVRIRRDDLRIRRFETRAEALTIFAVDASGSSALARLAEAKGAVELLLAEAYVKRAQVALVAFRGTTAELLLPPTRSLTRARRSLAELPGGGGTPLAAGLNAARELAETARTRARTPFIVMLTDGRANIAADGTAVRATAEADATAAAKAIGRAGIAAAFVDISARPRPEGAALASAMGARYLALPRADATAMHAAVSAVRPR